MKDIIGDLFNGAVCLLASAYQIIRELFITTKPTMVPCDYCGLWFPSSKIHKRDSGCAIGCKRCLKERGYWRTL